MKPKILITGGVGYIGSHTVVELVNAGYEPVVVDNFSNSYEFMIDQVQKITQVQVKYYNIDCNTSELKQVFEQEGEIFGVIHFAAYKAVGESVSEPLKYYKNNVGSLINLLELMEEHKVKNLVFSSSCTVYGAPKESPVSELSPIQKAFSPYGNTKQICEDILQDIVKSKKEIKVSLLRYFNPIGAHPSGLIGEIPIGVPSNLIPFITQTAIGKREKLTVFGDDYDTVDGSCVRDYIHVIDLARAHISAFELCAKQREKSYIDTFNIGTGKGETVLNLIKTFEKVTGQKLNVSIGARRLGDVPEIYAQAEKASKKLNWKAELSIEQALEDAWRWERNLQEHEQQFK